MSLDSGHACLRGAPRQQARTCRHAHERNPPGHTVAASSLCREPERTDEYAPISVQRAAAAFEAVISKRASWSASELPPIQTVY